MKKTTSELPKKQPEPPAISAEVSGAFNEIFHVVATEGFELSLLPGFFKGNPVIHLIAVDTKKGVLAPLAMMYDAQDLKYITGPDNVGLLEMPDATTSDLIQ